ncbi:MAG: Mut7-C RNAse domain-containing protein [Terracidiphilus sp.]
MSSSLINREFSARVRSIFVRECARCRRVYWYGSHCRRMRRWIEQRAATPLAYNSARDLMTGSGQDNRTLRRLPLPILPTGSPSALEVCMSGVS